MKNILIFCFCCCYFSAFAQPMDDEYFYGFKGGITMNSIGGISNTLIPSIFPKETYTTTNVQQMGFIGGLFFYHRFRDSRIAIQPEILFAKEGAKFEYTDINDLNYGIDFNYQYLKLATYFKIYSYAGITFSIGPQVGLNIGEGKLNYTSNMPDLGPDLIITQSLREVLKGATNFSVSIGGGYDFDFGLSIEARYNLGLKDVIETQANGYDFIENDNKTAGFQLTVGWLLPFDE